MPFAYYLDLALVFAVIVQHELCKFVRLSKGIKQYTLVGCELLAASPGSGSVKLLCLDTLDFQIVQQQVLLFVGAPCLVKCAKYRLHRAVVDVARRSDLAFRHSMHLAFVDDVQTVTVADALVNLLRRERLWHSVKRRLLFNGKHILFLNGYWW